MKIAHWKTKITDTYEEEILVRGYDLTELIGRLSFGEMFYLLTRGELPAPNTGKMIDAMLVACADHGIITTSVAARYAIASGTPLQGALAAGVLMIGDVYGGAVEQAACFFHKHGEIAAGKDIDAIAVEIVKNAGKNNKIPGFGHPLHSKGDPRTIRLFALARQLGVAGKSVALATALESELSRHTGKLIPINADGALGALAIDLGFDWRICRSFMLLSRTAGVLAHAGEELCDGTRWRLPPPAEYEARSHEDYYEGPPRRSLPVLNEGGRRGA
jgi:citrate synthase